MMNEPPSRGEVWTINLSPVRGHEQAGRRPCLVVSVDLFNKGPAGLAVILPITTKAKKVPWHVGLSPPEGGMRQMSYVKCEDVRSVSTERLSKRLGAVSPETLRDTEDRLRILMGL